jgi:hypothetical protein
MQEQPGIVADMRTQDAAFGRRPATRQMSELAKEHSEYPKKSQQAAPPPGKRVSCGLQLDRTGKHQIEIS